MWWIALRGCTPSSATTSGRASSLGDLRLVGFLAMVTPSLGDGGPWRPAAPVQPLPSGSGHLEGRVGVDRHEQRGRLDRDVLDLGALAGFEVLREHRDRLVLGVLVDDHAEARVAVDV